MYITSSNNLTVEKAVVNREQVKRESTRESKRQESTRESTRERAHKREKETDDSGLWIEDDCALVESLDQHFYEVAECRCVDE